MELWQGSLSAAGIIGSSFRKRLPVAAKIALVLRGRAARFLFRVFFTGVRVVPLGGLFQVSGLSGLQLSCPRFARAYHGDNARLEPQGWFVGSVEPYAHFAVSLTSDEWNRNTPAVHPKGRSAKLPGGLWLWSADQRDSA
jgi:hypothetical protein